jgi:hypothetical protein
VNEGRLGPLIAGLGLAISPKSSVLNSLSKSISVILSLNNEFCNNSVVTSTFSGKKKWASAHLSCSALYQRVISYES